MTKNLEKMTKNLEKMTKKLEKMTKKIQKIIKNLASNGITEKFDSAEYFERPDLFDESPTGPNMQSPTRRN